MQPSPSENIIKVRLSQPLKGAKLAGFEPGTPAINRKPPAWTQGYSSAQAELGQKVQNLEATLRNAAAEFRKIREAEMKALEPQVLELAISISKAVLHKEIEKGSYNIEAIVGEILAPLRKSEQALKLHLNPEDQKTLSQLGSGNPWPEVQVVADASVARASCCIKTAYGTIVRDAGTLLQEIEKALRSEGAGAKS